jgi:type II secretory pathway pseudopilin PulG
MKQIKKTKKQESGRSMIEMVGVLAVMGLITAAAFVLITSAMKSQKLSNADDQVAAIASGVRLLYANSQYFDGLGTASSQVMDTLGYGKTNSPYGGAYSVAEATCSDGSKCTGFKVEFDAGDASTCTSLALRTWPSSGSPSCSDSKISIVFDKGN